VAAGVLPTFFAGVQTTVAGSGAPASPAPAGRPFRYNRPRGLDPLGIGMTNDQPTPVDWDRDGRTDLIQRNIYSHGYRQPYWGVFLWRNVGSNRAPRFAPAVRLSVGGVLLEDRYACWQVMDWNRDGKPDLVSGSGRRLRVYLQSDGVGDGGLPHLTTGPVLSIEGGGELSYGMRLLDWSGSGRLDLFTLRSKVQYFPTPEVSYSWFRHPNRSLAGEAPVFGPAELVPLGGKPVFEACPNDFLDWDGDGLRDAIGADGDLGGKPSQPCVVVWRNTGTAVQPAFGAAPERHPELSSLSGAVATVVRSPALTGLLISEQGGWLRYYRQVPGSGPARFEDRGLLRAEGQPCSSGGYNSTEVADWDGDGDSDLLSGNEFGSLFLFENRSRRGREMFATPRPLTADGAPLRVARWTFLNDHDPEWNYGQSKPCAADWDGDGDLDLMVGNNTNRIAYYENTGDRRHPRLESRGALRSDSGLFFSFRKRPVMVDWNDDGLMDLVCGDQGPRDRNDGTDQTICLYRRYRDSTGRLRLGAGEPFLSEAGGVIRLPIPYVHGFEVADWDRNGSLDLFTNERGRLYLYRNVGAQPAPRFRRAMLLADGLPIEIGHHETSVKVVDWDRDGAPDLVCGGESGWIYFFSGRRVTVEGDPAPGR
jgi:hypothetical protein